MGRFRAVLFALVVVGNFIMAASVGNAVYLSGNQLAVQCFTDKSDHTYDLKDVYCLAYIVGVADSFSCSAPLAGMGWKPQSGIVAGQLVKVVMNFLGKHPEALHQDASWLVVNALAEAFPCN